MKRLIYGRGKCPSLISRTVSVDDMHHIYLLSRGKGSLLHET